MQQHPDYKYRPRRKPKPLVKSPSSNGHASHNGNSANNTSSHHLHHSHHSNSSGSASNNNNNNNNDSRSSNNNLHHHHHSLKSTSPSIIASHLHPHHHSSKYSFVPTIELPISFPPTQHSQQQAVFPSSIHYPLVDPTLALDLQARLHAMYMNAYYPWRLPLISSTSSSPPSSNHYASSPKISPTTTTNSPPPPIDKNSHSPDTQTTIIWPTPVRYHNAEWIFSASFNFNGTHKLNFYALSVSFNLLT